MRENRGEWSGAGAGTKYYRWTCVSAPSRSLRIMVVSLSVYYSPTLPCKHGRAFLPSALLCLTPFQLCSNQGTKEEGKLQAVLCWPLYHCEGLYWAGHWLVRQLVSESWTHNTLLSAATAHNTTCQPMSTLRDINLQRLGIQQQLYMASVKIIWQQLGPVIKIFLFCWAIKYLSPWLDIQMRQNYHYTPT